MATLGLRVCALGLVLVDVEIRLPFSFSTLDESQDDGEPGDSLAGHVVELGETDLYMGFTNGLALPVDRGKGKTAF